MDELTYRGSGVDYTALDAFKRTCQRAARQTASPTRQLGLQEETWSRGESFYVAKHTRSTGYIGLVHEGLGTKNLVADEMERLTGLTYYDSIGQDTVAAGVNDILTGGLMPALVTMHLGVGESSWFDNRRRADELIKGWVKACALSGCTWSGGETPALKDIIQPRAAELSCSVVGLLRHESYLIRGDNIRPNDVIVFLESSGLHANGLTLARRIADRLPQGYLTDIGAGQTYGAAIMSPTSIYVSVVKRCQDAGVPIHYAVNITGHGWRKLLRAKRVFTYVIDRLPAVPPVCQFIQSHGPISDAEAYGNLNMGAGFALIVAPERAGEVVEVARSCNVGAIIGGRVIASKDGVKRVVIEPLKIVWTGRALGVRA